VESKAGRSPYKQAKEAKNKSKAENRKALSVTVTERNKTRFFNK
jgi:hypothetical protein